MSSLAPPLVWRQQTATLSRARARMLVGAAGLAWALVWAISLSRNLFDPIGFDQAFWQYAYERVHAGQRMYVEVWDQNAPGILGVHWLATVLVGRSPLDLRLFDGVWQLVTMAALALLAVRDGRSPATGLLAATLYALAYYAGGYVHTAQRDGFAVLPMLLAMHIAATPLRGGEAGARIFSRTGVAHLLAGVLCFLVFMLKPPLGVVLAVMGWFALKDARRLRGWFAVASLTAGFMMAAGVAAFLMMRWDWWEGFLGAISRKDVPGYVLGPQLLRTLAPSALLGLSLWTMLWIAGLAAMRSAEGSPQDRPHGRQIAWRCWSAGVVVLLLLLSLWTWEGWREVSPFVLGLLIPALASWLRCPAEGRSRTWRLVALMAAATGAVIVLQGQFFLYHFWPLVACLAYLAAAEIADQSHALRRAISFRAQSETHPAYAALCCCAVIALASHPWYQKMSFYSREPYVLSHMSLTQYYDAVTKHKPRYPLYSASFRAADRIRACTSPEDPIACLINEPRIYYLAQRPPVHRLIITNPAFQPMFEDFIMTLAEKKPCLLVARVPESLRGQTTTGLLHQAVFDDAVHTFGVQAEKLRNLYVVAEVIDDVCLLKPAAGE